MLVDTLRELYFEGGDHNDGMATWTPGKSISKWRWEGISNSIDQANYQPDQLLVHQCQAPHPAQVGPSAPPWRTREGPTGKRRHVQWQPSNEQPSFLVRYNTHHLVTWQRYFGPNMTSAVFLSAYEEIVVKIWYKGCVNVIHDSQSLVFCPHLHGILLTCI